MTTLTDVFHGLTGKVTTAKVKTVFETAGNPELLKQAIVDTFGRGSGDSVQEVIERGARRCAEEAGELSGEVRTSGSGIRFDATGEGHPFRLSREAPGGKVSASVDPTGQITLTQGAGISNPGTRKILITQDGTLVASNSHGTTSVWRKFPGNDAQQVVHKSFDDVRPEDYV